MLRKEFTNDQFMHDIVAKSTMSGKFRRRTGGFCDYYINGTQIVLDSESLYECSKRILEIAVDLGVTHVGGEVASALPLIGAIIVMASLSNYQINGFFIRRNVKEYGTENIIEGDLTKSSSLLIVDDIIGKGSVAIRCNEILRSQGYTVKGFCAIVDRNEGAHLLLATVSLPLFSLYKMEKNS